jgi:hypothetical protein
MVLVNARSIEAQVQPYRFMGHVLPTGEGTTHDDKGDGNCPRSNSEYPFERHSRHLLSNAVPERREHAPIAKFSMGKWLPHKGFDVDSSALYFITNLIFVPASFLENRRS